MGHYKPFIDGLRAVSILSVVLYHVGVSGVPGGFVGVDVFFVISGFLIITQIVQALGAGKFSIWDFWSKRALRILPPYLLVIATSATIAPFVLVMPDEFSAFASQAGYSAVMIVNHLFLGQQGYFDGASDTKVLLHLWSLAVEEQFYVFAPMLLIALTYLPKRMIVAASVVLFLLSFAGCIYWTGAEGDKNYAFYLTALRAWEFMIGGAIGFAVPFAYRLPRLVLEMVAGAGLVTITWSVMTFSPSTMLFPSYWAAIPVLGAAAIILAGLANPGILTVRLLELSPMIGIGLVSYSWYLWHWPLLAFGRIYNFGEKVFPFDVAMALLSLALAVLTYRLVERPITKWRKSRKERTFDWRPAIAGLATCAVASLAVSSAINGLAEARALSFSRSMIPSSPVLDEDCQINKALSIEPCVRDAVSVGILIGDSQAESAAPELTRISKSAGAALMTMVSPGCVSLFAAKVFAPDTSMAYRCIEGRATMMALLGQSQIKPSYAILFSRWPLYGKTLKAYALGDESDKAPPKQQKKVFIAKFAETIESLASQGVERILVIAPTPEFKAIPPSCVLRSDHNGVSRERCGTALPTVIKYRERAVAWLSEAAAPFPSVRIIDPLSVFCDADKCLPYDERSVLFRDTNHISDTGVERIADMFHGDFEWVIGKPVVAGLR